MPARPCNKVSAFGLIAAAVAGVAALWVVRHKFCVVRTMSGLGLVHTIRDERGDKILVLTVGCVHQSATYLDQRRMEPPFAYLRAFDLAFHLVPDASRVLVIGGGGCAFPKFVAARHPGVVTDVIEVDPAVIEVARGWFFVDKAKELALAAGGDLRLICADGRAFLDRAAADSYDIICVDAFAGAEPVVSLVTAQAALQARSVVGDCGVVLVNVVVEDGEASWLRSVVATMATAFAHVATVPCSDAIHSRAENYLVVASDEPLGLSCAIPFDDDFLGEILYDVAACV